MRLHRLQPRLQNGAKKATTLSVQVARSSKKGPLCVTRPLVFKSRREPGRSSPWNQTGPAPLDGMQVMLIRVAIGILVQVAALAKEVAELVGSAMRLTGMVKMAVLGVAGAGMAVLVVVVPERTTQAAALLVGMLAATVPAPRTATPAAMARALVIVGRLGG